ncbi:hypothetical protein ACFFSY_08545 [Paenibacillus aurantiacus]|uniref:Uncharacterized protein n=1 Tax=Paenibacillus aurantiacus TaxID=1936118 RepID=A0ABV5KMX2_9BACL
MMSDDQKPAEQEAELKDIEQELSEQEKEDVQGGKIPVKRPPSTGRF